GRGPSASALRRSTSARPRSPPRAAEGAIFQVSLLRLGNVRCLGASMFLNSIGNMGENVVLGWLTLELTNSPFMVGAAMSMRALPLFFVGVPAGAIADRFPRHRLLMATSLGQAVIASTLGAIVLFGAV